MSEILDERKMKKLTSKANELKREHNMDAEKASWAAIDETSVGTVLVMDHTSYLLEEMDDSEMTDASSFEDDEKWRRVNAKNKLAKIVAERM